MGHLDWDKAARRQRQREAERFAREEARKRRAAKGKAKPPERQLLPEERKLYERLRPQGRGP